MGNQISHTQTVDEHDFVAKLDRPFHHIYLPFKRLFDLIFATLLMIPASIIILIFMILVKLETPGKCFYS
jgi:lipopolysaccharide/colanic/teichoic acid biosynthesis glycosyltransferase|nr:hypothetical protein [Levilactobacillus brevis]